MSKTQSAISRLTSKSSLTSGKWNKSGRPAWWARIKDEEGKVQFLNCFDAEGREILDIAVPLPVGTVVAIGCGTQAQIRESVVTTEIPADWKD